MKIKHVIVIIFSITTLWGCAHSPKTKTAHPMQEGWLDEDTYRIITRAETTRTITNPEVRKLSSERAAILKAQYRFHDIRKNTGLDFSDISLDTTGMLNFKREAEMMKAAGFRGS
ncbi:MAG: hypothetical protein GY754_29935 [bacterium]|nr:hypothetical protein [bacterium]